MRPDNIPWLWHHPIHPVMVVLVVSTMYSQPLWKKVESEFVKQGTAWWPVAMTSTPSNSHPTNNSSLLEITTSKYQMSHYLKASKESCISFLYRNSMTTNYNPQEVFQHEFTYFEVLIWFHIFTWRSILIITTCVTIIHLLWKPRYKVLCGLCIYHLHTIQANYNYQINYKIITIPCHFICR